MIEEWVVISGKGGTGKTSLTAAFAFFAGKTAVLADCDVDAANLHVVMQPRIRQREAFSGGARARINSDHCIQCGHCRDLCRFDAVLIKNEAHWIDAIRCEGCGVCAFFCPQKAIAFEPVQNGEWFVSDTRFGTLVHARLGVAEENSGKLVTRIRTEASRIAQTEEKQRVLIDGSPGIGCPVIASLTGVKKILIVTEPTQSGLHDLKRIYQLAGRFEGKRFICVNKWDLNPEMTEIIHRFCDESGGIWAGRIRYDDQVFKAQAALQSVPESTDQGVARDMYDIWKKMEEF